MVTALCLLGASVVAPTSAGAAALQWDGGGPNSNFSGRTSFSGLTNWHPLGGSSTVNLLPANGDSLTFAGLVRLSPLNDMTGLSLSGLAFAGNAGAFTLGGNALTLAGSYSNASASAQRITLAVTVGSDQTWTDSGGGSSTFAGTVALGNRALTLTGAITIDNPTQELSVGSTGTGSLTLNSGSRVNGQRGTIGNSAGSTGTATVNGGATWATTDRFHVGLSGNGNLLVQGGGRVDAAESYISYFGSSTSTATVTGAGSTWASTADMKVGVTGNATLNVADGGQVTNRDGYLGYVTGAQALVTIGGADAAWRNSRHLTVGLASGTSSTVRVNAGGLLEVGSQLTLNSGGVVQLDGGTLRAGSASRSAGGSFQWNTGLLDLGTLDLGQASSLTGANLVLQAGRNLRIGTALTVGTGSLQVNAGHALELADNSSFTGGLANNGIWLVRAGAYGNTVTGNGQLLKEGNGTVVYTGSAPQLSALVRSGVLQLGDGSTGATLGGELGLVNGATLRLNLPDGSAVANRLVGAGALQTVGAGALQFTGSAAMSGSSGSVHLFDARSTSFSGGGVFDLGLGTVRIATDRFSGRTQSDMVVSGAQVRIANVAAGTATGSGAPGAQLTLQGAGSLLAASGTVSIGAGSRAGLDVRDGARLTANRLSIGESGALGQATVSGAGTSVELSGSQGDSLRIGASGSGSLLVAAGAQVAVRDVAMGSVAGLTSQISLQEGSRMTAQGRVLVGVASTIRITTGASFLGATTLDIGAPTGTQAQVLLQGADSVLSADTVTLGRLGNGVISVAEGASFNSNVLTISNPGRLLLSGGTVRAGSATTTALNNLDWRSGTLALALPNNTAFDNFFRAPLTLVAGQTWQAGTAQSWGIDGGRVTLDGGTLELGSTWQLTGSTPFAWRSGTLAFSTGEDIQIADDAYFTSPLLMLETGKTLRTAGSLVVDPGTAVLLAGGRLQAAGVQLRGGKILGLGSQVLDMTDVASLSGHGTVSAAVQGGTATSLIAVHSFEQNPDFAPGSTGQVTMVLGDAHRADGFRYDGRLFADNARIVLLSADRAVLGVETSLGNSRLEAGAGLTLAAGRELLFSGQSEVLGDFHNEGRVAVDADLEGSDTTSQLTFLGQVTGAGSFGGDIVFQAGYSPGNSPAAVSFGGGDVVFGQHAVLTLEIGGTTPGSDHDQLYEIGQLSFDGQLVLSFVGGYAPTPGTRLQLLEFGSLTGNGLAADRIQVVGLDRRLLDLGSLASTGQVTAVPEPGTWALWLGGLAALGALARRRAGNRPAAA